VLLSPEPKAYRRDLYDREEELEKLSMFLRGRLGPMALLLGLRRTGKTSLLKVALAEYEGPSIILDLRRVEGEGKLSYRGLTQLLEEGLNRLGGRWRRRLLEALRSIKGVEASGLKVYLAWGGRRRVSLSDVLAKLSEVGVEEGVSVVVAFDEAQELSKAAGFRVDLTLAYAYDHLQGLKFILTGSKVGLLYRFIGVDNPKAPLYGRAMWEVKLSYFTPEQSSDFLTKGLEEAGVKASVDEVQEAVEELDGVPGWLTLYGYQRLTQGHQEALDRVRATAEALVLSEVESFLKLRPQARERYVEILKAVAAGEGAWSSIKRRVEAALGEPIPPKNYTELLNNLVCAGLLVRSRDGYAAPDKLMEKAYAKLR